MDISSSLQATELVNTWLGFVGEGLHPAVRAREAETRHLEIISSRLSPLVLGETNTCSKLGRSVATAILSNILLQAVIGIIRDGLKHLQNIMFRSDLRAPHHQQAPAALVQP